MSYWDLIASTVADERLRTRLTGEGGDETTVPDPITGRNGTWLVGAANGAAYSDDKPPTFHHGQSLSFGPHSALVVGSLNVNNVQDMTCSAWVKTTEGWGYLFNGQENGASLGNRVNVRLSNTGLWGYQWGAETLWSRPNCDYTPGVWQHIVYRAVAGHHSIWLNGTMAYENPTGNSANAAWGLNWSIGSFGYIEGTATHLHHFDGLVYDAMAWRSSLDFDEISLLLRGHDRPFNTSAPIIIGNAQSLSLLTCDPGLWDNQDNGPLSYKYQWQRDSGGDNNFSNIYSAEQSFYKLTSRDIGSQVRCIVSASNNSGFLSEENTASNIVSDITTHDINGTRYIYAADVQVIPNEGNVIIRSGHGIIKSSVFQCRGTDAVNKDVSAFAQRLVDRFKAYRKP